MDEQLTCSDCRTPFNFSAGEQAFYAERGYHKPRRCKPCREKRKSISTGATPQVAAPVQWTNGDADSFDRQPRRKTFGKTHRKDNAY